MEPNLLLIFYFFKPHLTNDDLVNCAESVGIFGRVVWPNWWTISYDRFQVEEERRSSEIHVHLMGNHAHRDHGKAHMQFQPD